MIQPKYKVTYVSNSCGNTDELSNQPPDADRKMIQDMFDKEHQRMTGQMQTHIREVNSMFADERKQVRNRYKEYDGTYLGHYAQRFFGVFFTIGFFVVAGGIGMMVCNILENNKPTDLRLRLRSIG